MRMIRNALLWTACLAATSSLLAQSAPVAEPAPVPAADFPSAPSPDAKQIISASGQFRISGGEAAMRSSLSFLAESTKDELQALSQKPATWKIPISILLHGKQGDPIPARQLVNDLQWGEDGFRLSIHAHIAQGLNQARLRSAILAALIYEKSLRNLPPGPLEEKLIVRPWLIEGISEALDWRAGKSDRRLYQAIFQSGGLFRLEEMLDVSQTQWDDSDAAMRAAFRVSAGGLIMALLEQPSGQEGFDKFLNEAAQFGGDMPVLLRKHFPSLSLSQKSLEKWWALQMANQARLSLTEVMTIADTEQALRQALQLRLRDESGLIRMIDVAAWEQLHDAPQPARAFGVAQAQDALIRLSYRCFPSYRPILVDYQSFLQSLVKAEKKEQLAASLRDLDETRLIMQQRSARAIDYLDWFEITRARETSGVFDDYIKLKKRLDQGINARPDHLSRYLDRAQQLFQR
jgi:hypothetical protein